MNTVHSLHGGLVSITAAPASGASPAPRAEAPGCALAARRPFSCTIRVLLMIQRRLAVGACSLRTDELLSAGRALVLYANPHTAVQAARQVGEINGRMEADPSVRRRRNDPSY